MATYYCATNGNDANAGTVGSPWRNINVSAPKLANGDTLLVRGGTYYETVSLGGSGASGAPKTIKAYPGETVIIDGQDTRPTRGSWVGLIHISGQWWVIENITLRNSNERGLTIYGSNNTVRGIDLDRSYKAGIFGTNCTNVLIEGCLVRHAAIENENGAGVAENNWAGGITIGQNNDDWPGQYANTCTIRGCTTYQNWGEGISTYCTHDILIEDNLAYNNWSVNIYVNTTPGSIVRRNICFWDSSFNSLPDYPGRIPGWNIGLIDETWYGNYPASQNVQITNNLGKGGAFGVLNYARTTTITGCLIAHNTNIGNSYFGSTGSGTTIANNVLTTSAGAIVGGADPRLPEYYVPSSPSSVARLASVLTDYYQNARLNPTISGGIDTQSSGGGATNVALGKTYSASSVEIGNPASDAFDNNTTTTRWSSEFSDPQWLKVDLGAVHAIDGVTLYWEAAYASSYQIQVSNDDINWTTVYSTTSGAGGSINHPFTASGRYVRMYGTARGTAWGYSIYEFQVFGSPTSTGDLSAAQTSHVMVSYGYRTLPPGLVAAYGFNEGTGTTAQDRSGYQHHGAIGSGVSWEEAGKYGKCLRFDGVAGKVTVAHTAALTLANFTLAAWVNPDALANAPALIKQRSTGSASWWLFPDSDVFLPQGGFTNSGGAYLKATGAARITTGVWTHLAATYDGAVIRMYVNGTQVGTYTTTDATVTDTGDITIGHFAPWGQWFDGLIDEVQIYSRALSAAEIVVIRDTPLGETGGVLDVTHSDNTAAAGGALALSGSLSVSQTGDVVSAAGGGTAGSTFTQGPFYAGGVVNDAGIGTGSWTNPGDAAASDDTYATRSTASGSTTNYLKATGFGFSIPAGATINGITVEVERKALNATRVLDAAVRIVKGGAVGSTDRSSGSSWPTSDAFASYGGSADLWGESWSAADVNAFDFGFAIAVVGAVGASIAYVDAIRITIDYTLPPLNGALSATHAGNMLVASGSVALSGALSGTQAGNTALSGGALAVTGSFAKTQGGDTLASDSQMGGSFGLLGVTQAGNTLVASGTVAIAGALSGAQAGNTLSASGVLPITGTLNKAQSGDVLFASNLPEIVADLHATQQPNTLSAVGVPQPITTVWYRPKRILLAEIDAYDPGTASVVTYRFSDLLGYDNNGVFYKPRIEHPAYMRRDASSVLLGGRAAQSYGEWVLHNQDGELDAMADDFFDGRNYRLLLGDEGAPYASFQTILVATTESVSFSNGLVSGRFRDRSVELDAPFISVQYAGTNSLPSGIEGTADDIKGQYKPRIFGRIALMRPELVNTSKLIYQINAVAVDAVINVFDAGAYLGREADYTSQSDMENNQPSPNYFRAWPAGGCFRLGSSAFGQVSASVAEKWMHTSISAAGVIKRILQELGWTAQDYVEADFVTLDQKCAGPVGVVVDGGEMASSLIDRIAASVGAWWGFDQLNRFRIGRLDAPGTPVLTIRDEHIKAGQIDRVPPLEQAVWQTTVQADRNHAVQDKRGMAGVVGEDRVAWFNAETRDQKAVNSSVKTWRLLAQDKVYTGVLCSISQAQAEATRRLDLLSGRRDVVTLTLCDPMRYIGVLDIGVTMRVQTTDLGYDAGRDLVVIGLGANYRDDVLDLILWG